MERATATAIFINSCFVARLLFGFVVFPDFAGFINSHVFAARSLGIRPLGRVRSAMAIFQRSDGIRDHRQRSLRQTNQ